MSDKRIIPDYSEQAHGDTNSNINPAVLASFVILMLCIAVFVTVVSNFANKDSSSEIIFGTSGTRETSTSVTEIRTETETYVTSKQYTFPADINLVSKEQLTEIDGIGEKTAEMIINYRTEAGKIRNMEMLLEIDGIGEKTLYKLKKYLYVSSADYSEITTASPATMTVSSTVLVPSKTSVTTKVSQIYVTTTVSTTKKLPEIAQMSRVNINTATAEELAKCLLLNEDTARKIVELRDQIGYFSNDLELLYVDGFSESMLLERRPYIALED